MPTLAERVARLDPDGRAAVARVLCGLLVDLRDPADRETVTDLVCVALGTSCRA